MKSGLKLSVEDFVCEDNQVYFISSVPKIIGEYDYQSDTLDVLLDYSQIVNIFRPFSRIIKYQHKIYCMPCNAENIYCYDLISGKFYSLNIPDVLLKKMPKRKIIEAIEVEGYIYCVCRSPHMVFVLDAETDEYKAYFDNTITGVHDFFSIQLKGNCLIYPLSYDSIVNFDMEKRAFYIEKLYDASTRNDGDYIFHFVYDETGYIWMCNHKGVVYKVKNNQLESVELPKEGITSYRGTGDSFPYLVSEILYEEGQVYFVIANPNGHCILRYTMSKNNFEWIDAEKCHQPKRKRICFDICRVCNNILYVYRADDNLFYRWNFETGFLGEFGITVSGDIAVELHLDISSYEATDVNLKFYLDYVKRLDNNNTKNKNLINEDIGKAIYLFR